MKKHEASHLLRQVELAELTGTAWNTMKQWYFRGHLPEPDFMVWEHPAWEPETAVPFVAYVKAHGTACGYNG